VTGEDYLMMIEHNPKRYLSGHNYWEYKMITAKYHEVLGFVTKQVDGVHEPVVTEELATRLISYLEGADNYTCPTPENFKVLLINGLRQPIKLNEEVIVETECSYDLNTEKRNISEEHMDASNKITEELIKEGGESNNEEESTEDAEGNEDAPESLIQSHYENLVNDILPQLG
jgi:hypothetical protein